MKKLLFFALSLHLNISLYAQPTSAQHPPSTIPLKVKIIIAGEAAVIIYCLVKLYKSSQKNNTLTAANITLQRHAEDAQPTIEVLNQGAQKLREELTQATTQRDNALKERDTEREQKEGLQKRAEVLQARLVELMDADQKYDSLLEKVAELKELSRNKDEAYKSLVAENNELKGKQEHIKIAINNEHDTRDESETTDQTSWFKLPFPGASVSSFFSY